MSYKVGFGKHRDRTLEWLFFNDPGYAWWIIDNGATKNLSSGARARFDALIRRAKHLRVPGRCDYCSEPATKMILVYGAGGLASVDFVCDDRHYDSGNRSYAMKPAFYTPDYFKNYDKLGARILVNAIKRRFLPANQRMAQKAMEAFFDDPNNFVNY